MLFGDRPVERIHQVFPCLGQVRRNLATIFGSSAAGNIDSDGDFDLWFISSVSATTAGICPTLTGTDMNTPAGEPKNTYNDVNCP